MCVFINNDNGITDKVVYGAVKVNTDINMNGCAEKG